jgi:hypothetical protein
MVAESSLTASKLTEYCLALTYAHIFTGGLLIPLRRKLTSQYVLQATAIMGANGSDIGGRKMLKVLSVVMCGMAMGLLSRTADAQTQTITQRVVYPDGRVVIETISVPQMQPTRPTPWSGPPAAAVICDPCRTSSQTCSGCQTGCNWPHIHVNGPGCNTQPPVIIDIPIIKDTEIEEVEDGDVPFYKTCESFDFEIDVPYIKKHSSNWITFTNVTYTHKCCRYTVCVPCQCIKQSKEECKIKRVPATLVKKVRQNGEIDVYVVGLRGFPKEWVLCLEINQQTFGTKFPNVPLTICP